LRYGILGGCPHATSTATGDGRLLLASFAGARFKEKNVGGQGIDLHSLILMLSYVSNPEHSRGDSKFWKQGLSVADGPRHFSGTNSPLRIAVRTGISARTVSRNACPTLTGWSPTDRSHRREIYHLVISSPTPFLTSGGLLVPEDEARLPGVRPLS